MQASHPLVVFKCLCHHRIFAPAVLKQISAISFGANLWSHRSFQNFVLCPFPTTIDVQTWNNLSSASENYNGSWTHVFSGCTHFCNSHLNLSALLKHSMFFIPNPPTLLSLQVLLQLTGQHLLPPISSPLYRKFCLILSIFLPSIWIKHW